MQNLQDLAEVLGEQFTDTELHGFVIAAEHPNNRGANHWERLRRAALKALDCPQCAATGRPVEFLAGAAQYGGSAL